MPIDLPPMPGNPPGMVMVAETNKLSLKII